jgi:hypothetical protein
MPESWRRKRSGIGKNIRDPPAKHRYSRRDCGTGWIHGFEDEIGSAQ